MDRVSRCGRVPNGQEVALKVTTDALGSRTAGWSGLQHCGSPWSCPVCSASISAERAESVASILDGWSAKIGGRVAMVTLTVRHSKRDKLRSLWDAVASAWHAATSGRAWVEAARRYGITDAKGKPRLHYVRVVEVTVGEAGWHVHVHALVFLGPQVGNPEQAVQDLTAGMWERWDRAAVRRGLRSGSFAACDGHLVRGEQGPLAEYFAKAVMEVVGAGNKIATGGNLTPFEVLGLLVDRDAGVEVPEGAPSRAQLMAWWREWEAGSRGRRQIGISRGLVALVGVDELRSDEEIAEDDELKGEVVLRLALPEWRRIVAAGADTQVLEAWERSPGEGLALVQLLIRR